MAYAIKFKPAALRQFEKLPRDVQKRIAARIHVLSNDPFPPGCKKLAGEPSAWRLRAGNYRVVYQVHGDVLSVLVVAIGHRRTSIDKGFAWAPLCKAAGRTTRGSGAESTSLTL